MHVHQRDINPLDQELGTGSSGTRTEPLQLCAKTQTTRALQDMRDLLLGGAFRPGERLVEAHLAARLNVSRTSLHLVFYRLERDGLLEARETRGFVAAKFSVTDFYDALEIGGTLKATAARLAAERLERNDELLQSRTCLRRIDRLLRRWTSVSNALSRYTALNDQLQNLLLDLAKSTVLRRASGRAVALHFSDPTTFMLAHAEEEQRREVIATSQMHQGAIIDAIANREPGRAEDLAREHARLARVSLGVMLGDPRLFAELPGASLITFGEEVGSSASPMRGFRLGSVPHLFRARYFSHSS